MEYIKSFNDSIIEAFEGMFEETIILENETASLDGISTRGVAVIIGITGGNKGRVLLDISLDTAMELGKQLDPDFTDKSFALFTVSEFCNMASGGGITMMNNNSKGLGLRLAPPSIFTGVNFRIFSPNLKAVLLSYNTRFGKIDFHIGVEGV